MKAVFKSGLMNKHIVKHIVFIEKDCVDWVLRGQCFIFGALYLVAPDQYTSTLYRETYRYRRLVGWLVGWLVGYSVWGFVCRGSKD